MMPEFRILLCVLIVGLCLFVTLDSAWRYLENPERNDDEEGWRDEKGRHLYYDRGSIEKEHFLERHPGVDHSELRTLRRLLRELFSRNQGL